MMEELMMVELRLAGFWDFERCKYRYNNGDIDFADYLIDILDKRSDIKFDVTEGLMFENPACEIYGVSVAIAYLDKPKMYVESHIFTVENY